ncbi:substrate-binding domain-containing protein [Streptococcus parauberis]|uniref:Sugar-binding domain protein n=2 Tax=Streptococcus parauberis TaxID=1348 RepID=F1YZZ1_9STRE|nr:substrate-binding domain-containing protein [Streptococcus parauberis]EGE54523.1 sugar-binding domain protein [Streptococcus parauberis NCFD 2020]UWM90805.1 substrate-binding domain-containing protein [Streptococcus parauberis]WEM62960.1 substrate-binding domain-containing protein [Streptococcus parauberis]GAJ61336.1 extracellular sugar-binding protein [Streptococcus parauberis]
MKSVKKLLWIFMFMILTVSVSIILTNKKVEQYSSKKLKVGTTYMTMNNPFYAVINEEIKKNISAVGGNVYTRDPGLDSKKQVKQIKYFIKNHMDVIILNPVKSDDSATIEIVKKAEKLGIKVIVVDSELSKKVKVTSTIISDNYNAGVLIAKDLIKRKSNANILILEHRGANSSEERISGFTNTMNNKEQYQIISRIETMGQTEISMPEVERVLNSGKKFDVVMALNDQAAIGAVAAIEKSEKKESFLIYGVDGSPDMKNLLQTTEKVTGTVSQSPIKMGKKAAELSILVSKKNQVPKMTVIPVKLITKQSVSSNNISGWQ